MDGALLYSRKPRRISLTALIDVVFILLMFFMLTSSFNQWRSMDFNAPVQGEASDEEQPRAAVLMADGALRWLDGQALSGANEAIDPARLAGASALLVLPEPSTPVQRIVARLEELNRAGISASLGGLAPTPESP